ncbi:MAG: hypothetical protein ABI828_04275 [Actinomycetota bacterium]
MTKGEGQHPAVERVLRAPDAADLHRMLVDLPGADLTSLLTSVMAERTAKLGATDVLRRHGSDRFTQPSAVPAAQLRQAEDLFVQATGWEWLVLAPLVPAGTFTAMGDLDPKRVVPTIRGSEVAADPTNTLALEAAFRRQRVLPRERLTLRLAAIQRVTRAQRFEDADAFAHFTLAGFVTAARGTQGRTFEEEGLREHVGVHVRALQAAGADAIEIALTDLTGSEDTNLQALCASFEDMDGDVSASADPQRAGGRSYYRSVCFKVHATFGSTRIELADGGDTDWTARLLSDRKERCFISGAGLDRLALAL